MPILLPISCAFFTTSVTYLGATPMRRHDFARRHGDFRRVHPEWTKHRATPALRTLVKISVPFLEHALAEFFGRGQTAGHFAGGREMAPINLPQQFGARRPACCSDRRCRGKTGICPRTRRSGRRCPDKAATNGAGATIHRTCSTPLRATPPATPPATPGSSAIPSSPDARERRRKRPG